MVPKGPGKPGHIFADTLLPTQMFPRLPMRATFVADTNFKFVSGTQEKVPQFAQPKKHHGPQCVRNNVSSFARAFKITRMRDRKARGAHGGCKPLVSLGFAPL